MTELLKLERNRRPNYEARERGLKRESECEGREKEEQEGGAGEEGRGKTSEIV